ncbi:trafficking protein particle complex subunit 6B [Antrostomus carolinensis]|uniref:trafficking protein particle complex subunit 6B n=1 Tax=Antrostomus carolinensis TaxID=279965 RepID=UPI000528419F|nr:trafficking protein particle complex subunit 6B [Antrostomus carolinensis]
MGSRSSCCTSGARSCGISFLRGPVFDTTGSSGVCVFPVLSAVETESRFTKDTARFKDELDIMKFICKDFWTTVFKKQIDNLRTNHQGIYVLQDNKFRLLTQMSAGKQYLEHAPKYLAFTCGLIRGGLSNLGIKSIVTAEVSSMPACKFQVMIQKM